MRPNKNTSSNYTVCQLKLLLETEKLIGISDPVYISYEVMDHIDLSKHPVAEGYKAGRPRRDEHKLLRVILFTFVKYGISSLYDVEKLYRNDIWYLYLLNDMKAPSFAAFGSFTHEELADSIRQVFLDINIRTFQEDHADLGRTYLDGTKIKASANRYTWVWRELRTRGRGKVLEKISILLDAMDQEVLGYLDLKLEKQEEYAISYVSELLGLYRKGIGLKESTFVPGYDYRKSIYRKQCQELQGYLERLRTCAHHMEVCKEERNSHSKTGHSTAFMRLKRDCVGNDQLPPTYSLQTAVCDGYIAVVDVKPYTSDMECFVLLMKKFRKTYGCCPEYPITDAGHDSYNNYLYYEEHGMEKCARSTMLQKETKDKKYHENPYRVVNFQGGESENLLCPGGRKSRFKCRHPVYKNQHGRAEELYECESCEGCEYKNECSPKASSSRTVHTNEELTAIHQEMLSNLESIHGTLLRMNGSIQAEKAFGILGWDRSYRGLFRRGKKNMILKLTLIFCRFNTYKYHNKKQRGEAIT